MSVNVLVFYCDDFLFLKLCAVGSTVVFVYLTSVLTGIYVSFFVVLFNCCFNWVCICGSSTLFDVTTVLMLLISQQL